MNDCQELVNAIKGCFTTDVECPLFIRFLSEHGREMPMKHVSEITGLSKSGECYKNSYELMLRGPYTYCEGYAIKKGLIPLEHAWVIDQEGNVIDPTWDGECEYFGVSFKDDFVFEMIERVHHYGINPNLYLLRLDVATVYDMLEGSIHANV